MQCETPSQMMLGLACLAVLGACGLKTPEGLTKGESGQVIKVSEEGRLMLADGLVVRLAAIEVPVSIDPATQIKPSLARTTASTSGKADQSLPARKKEHGPAPRRPAPSLAQKALADAVMGRQVQLFYDGRKRDGRGAALAQLYAKTEAGEWLWVQQHLVEAGLARVRTTPNERHAATELLQMEDKARKAGLGLWADARFRVRPANPDALADEEDEFVLTEGTIQSTTKTAGRVFLNFGEDYLTDFTASIPEDAWPAWPGGSLDLLDLGGTKVRVRGVIDWHNGPSTELTHPEQIERLD